MNIPTMLISEVQSYIKAGRYAEAELALKKILSRCPDNPSALSMLGIVALKCGKFENAVQILEKLIAIAPTDAIAQMNLGNAYMGIRQDGNALDAFSRAYVLKPSNGQIAYNYGISLFNKGKVKESIRPLKKAVAGDKRNPVFQMSLGAALASTGDLTGGLRALMRAETITPDDPTVLRNHGKALLDAGYPKDAIKRFRKVTNIIPNAKETFLSLASAHLAMGQSWESLRILDALVEQYPDFHETHLNLSDLHAQRGYFEAALRHAEYAVKKLPETYQPIFNLLTAIEGCKGVNTALERAKSLVDGLRPPHSGHVWSIIASLHQSAGDFDQAHFALKKSIENGNNPGYVFLHMLKDQGGGLEKIDALADQIGKMIETRTAPSDIAHTLYFGLYQYHERKGDNNRAFNYLTKGNKLRNAEHSQSLIDNKESISLIIETFSKSLIEQASKFGKSSEVPIFIVGLPRSGTSLAAQIIAAHPKAASAGELSIIKTFTNEISARFDLQKHFPHCVEFLQQSHISVMREEYLTGLLKLCGEQVRRCVDKMPDNFLYLGLISILFPNSRVIHCRRDLMDNCFSIYQQSFRGRHPYAYDFKKMVNYVGQYRKLMDHWHRILPLPILNLDYEALINKSDEQIHRVVEFAGLDWDNCCLHFHETRSEVKTASVWQVRQPLYQSAIEKWKKYETELKPLKKALEKEFTSS